MTPEALFRIANTLALAGWIVLAIFGRRRWAASVVAGALLPLLFAVLYGALIVSHLGQGQGGFGTLAQVALLFANPWLLLAGWVHYLAFDLFIGSWQVRDAQRLGIPHWFVVPCLFLTFMLGPLGLLAWFALRRRLAADESSLGAPAALA